MESQGPVSNSPQRQQDIDWYIRQHQRDEPVQKWHAYSGGYGVRILREPVCVEHWDEPRREYYEVIAVNHNCTECLVMAWYGPESKRNDVQVVAWEEVHAIPELPILELSPEPPATHTPHKRIGEEKEFSRWQFYAALMLLALLAGFGANCINQNFRQNEGSRKERPSEKIQPPDSKRPR